MGADSSAENIPNAPKFIFPICLPKPKPKSLEFQWKKASLGVRSPCGLVLNTYQDFYTAVCNAQWTNALLISLQLFRNKAMS